VNEYPLVTIVTPVYNGSAYLEDLIESVLNQDYPRLEHIIIDDGSDDGGATRSILERYGHLRSWSRQNLGQYATQNEAIAAANGDVFVVVAGDDVLASNTVVSSVIDYWRARPELDGVYGKTLVVDECLRPLPVQNSTVWRFPPWLMRYYMCISHSALYLRRDWVISRDIWFDPQLRFAGDWEWVSRLVGAGCSLGFVDEMLSLYRYHSAQATQTTQVSRLMAEYEEVWRRNGVSPLSGKTVRAVFALHGNARKAAWVARTQGITALAGATLDWAGRRVKQASLTNGRGCSRTLWLMRRGQGMLARPVNANSKFSDLAARAIQRRRPDPGSQRLGAVIPQTTPTEAHKAERDQAMERFVREEEALDYDDVYRRRGAWWHDTETQVVLGLLKPRLDEVVLDVGCGTGRMTLEIAPRVAAVHGIDFSPRSVEILLRKVADLGLEDVTAATQDITADVQFDGVFDAAVSVQVVQHVPSDALRFAALRNVFGALRPGGRLVVSVYRWGGMIRADKEGYWGKGLYRYAFTASELRDTLREAGYVDIDVVRVLNFPAFRHVPSLVRPLRALDAWLSLNHIEIGRGLYLAAVAHKPSGRELL